MNSSTTLPSVLQVYRLYGYFKAIWLNYPVLLRTLPPISSGIRSSSRLNRAC